MAQNHESKYFTGSYAQAYLYKLSVLSGMCLNSREGYNGPYFFATNGQNVVAFPIKTPMTEEQFVINIKNICKANNLDFNKYFQEHQKYVQEGQFELPPPYFAELESDIVERLKDLPPKQYDNVAQMLEDETEERLDADNLSAAPRKILSIGDYRRYCYYYQKHLESGKSLPKNLSEQQIHDWSEAEFDTKEKLKEISVHHQQKSIENLKETKLEDFNDQELN